MGGEEHLFTFAAGRDVLKGARGGRALMQAKTFHHTVSLYTALTRWAVLKVIAGSLVKSILHMFSHVNRIA